VPSTDGHIIETNLVKMAIINVDLLLGNQEIEKAIHIIRAGRKNKKEFFFIT
jgi:t-SNARE complex subunit (syntaxin)